MINRSFLAAEKYFAEQMKTPTLTDVDERVKKAEEVANRCLQALAALGPELHEIANFSKFVTPSDRTFDANSPLFAHQMGLEPISEIDYKGNKELLKTKEQQKKDRDNELKEIVEKKNEASENVSKRQSRLQQTIGFMEFQDPDSEPEMYSNLETQKLHLEEKVAELNSEVQTLEKQELDVQKSLAAIVSDITASKNAIDDIEREHARENKIWRMKLSKCFKICQVINREVGALLAMKISLVDHVKADPEFDPESVLKMVSINKTTPIKRKPNADADADESETDGENDDQEQETDELSGYQTRSRIIEKPTQTARRGRGRGRAPSARKKIKLGDDDETDTDTVVGKSIAPTNKKAPAQKTAPLSNVESPTSAVGSTKTAIPTSAVGSTKTAIPTTVATPTTSTTGPTQATPTSAGTPANAQVGKYIDIHTYHM